MAKINKNKNNYQSDTETSKNYKEIDLLQNLNFAVSCTDIKLTKNKNFLISSGTYKPSVKIHDLNNLSFHLERNLDCEIIKIQPLEDNHQKLALLRTDKRIEFHAKYGKHETTNIDFFPRDIIFNRNTSELFIIGKKILPLNLEDGRFETPIDIEAESIDINPKHPLIGCTNSESLFFIDNRTKTHIKSLSYTNPTNIQFSNNGINFIISTDNKIIEHDLRSTNPLNELTHNNITNIKYHNNKIISTSKETINLYNNHELELQITDKNINKIENIEGIIAVGYDTGEIKTYYSELLGRIPQWCTFVENVM
ncbi:nucleolar protein 10 like protein [Spraguea lophii 42_110]|uniref:Nucleolar protein 10 like protein n=1 Tax=Spraguea lophii (strain 42_110) TaxID=1358809 RepID=S7XHJ5_SPRLO|nr:nucleolar protein 10 like protein [Spraguea lophii 42_110]